MPLMAPKKPHVELKLQGMDSAIRNKPQKQAPHLNWGRKYNSRCLIEHCSTPVYYDGKIYFSLCLFHLEELDLGPFHKVYIPEDGYE
tara:strand:+ start:220 stop:480 length:261 start_codon:yes stop_codon:yes gene_type:complete